MQLKSILIIAAAASICLTATARKKKKTTAQPVVAAQQLKPVEGRAFSYALGVAQGKSLRQFLAQREGVDTAYMRDAMAGMTDTSLSEAERKQREAFAAGLKIADMNKRNLSVFNKQAAGKEDTTYVDLSEFQRGLADVVNGQTTALTPDSAMKIVEQQFNYQKQTYKQANEQFLEGNKKLKGVITLPSGLQYRVLTQGAGIIAKDSTEVEVHYEGKLIDGTVFDSSYKRNKPSTFRPDQVIKGWREALTMMPEGSVWELYIPASLAYGEQGNQAIPGNSTLIFKVELLKVKSPATEKAAPSLRERHKEIIKDKPVLEGSEKKSVPATELKPAKKAAAPVKK